ncbi:DUF3794 domain-containing protein [Schnuerera sp. xch1]|uniref:DUF3794 and LysM peptidoglycan-binding domain-containing protein n=1 Tax=Schnuerera sp. xch1 TaxID=2874283 RepID=UPI001CC0C273|nr:SPOCS domain-containing protein [Schnuerera sp. xch1]MBZ2175086.1 DUF3794 domain-containing protein [Schnuerera sp. xch1]
MEIVKDILRVEEQKGYERIESLMETEIYLSQSKPEIDNILWTDGKIEILSTKIVQGKVLINGLAKLKVVYKSNEEELNIYAVETNNDFKEEIEIEGITESMAVEVKTNLEYIEHELLDERKISLNALINLWARVEETNSVEIIKEVVEKPDLQVLKEKVKYNDILGREESYALIKEAFEVNDDQPPIDEILKIDMYPHEKELSISADRLILSGILECSIIYFGGNKLNSINRGIPFTHFIETENIEYDSKCKLNMEVENGEYEIRENLEGDLRILDVEAKIKIVPKLYRQEEKEVIIDAYSIKEKVDLQTEEIKIMENIKDIVNKEDISKEITGENFKEIYAIEADPRVIDNQYVEDKIVIEGILALNIYYLNEINDEISTFKEEVPFKTYVTTEDLGNDAIINTETSLESLKHNLKDNVLYIDAIVKNNIFIDRERKINIINDIEENGEIIDKKDRPSIIVYIIQKDDTLWDIAKRYNTTVDEIIESNDIISPPNLMPGEKIIIEKKVDIDF